MIARSRLFALLICAAAFGSSFAGVAKPPQQAPSGVAPAVMLHAHKDAPRNPIELAAGREPARAPSQEELTVALAEPAWTVQELKAFDSLVRVTMRTPDSKYTLWVSMSSSVVEFAKLVPGDAVHIERKGEMFLLKKGSTVLMGAAGTAQTSGDLRGTLGRPRK